MIKTEPHWLTRFCDKDAPDHRAFTREPFLLKVRGKWWTAATDGKTLVAVAGAVEAIGTDAAADKMFLPFLANRPTKGTRCALAVIQKWCGSVPWSMPCPKCKGVPESTCPKCYGSEYKCQECGQETECPDCEGSGKCTCQKCEGGVTRDVPGRFGLFFGALVNRVRLGLALENIHNPPTVNVAWLGSAADPVWVWDSAWVVSVMTLDGDTTHAKGDPFPVAEAS